MEDLRLTDLDSHLLLARSRDDEARVFAFHDPGNVTYPAIREIEGSTWRIVVASSELGIRAAMVDRTEDEFLAIVTSLETRDLAYDIRARIAKNQLLVFDPWESVMPIFNASAIDPRLRTKRALGRALLSAARSKLTPAQTGILSEEEAWNAVFEHVLGIGLEPGSVGEWLRWCTDFPAEAATHLMNDSDLWKDIEERALSRCGPGLTLLFAALRKAIAETTPLDIRLLALGHAAAAGRRAVSNSATNTLGSVFLARLEPYFGLSPSEEALRSYASESTSIGLDDKEQEVISALDVIFEITQSVPISAFSHISTIGYKERLKQLASTMEGRLVDTSSAADLRRAFEWVQAHNRSRESSNERQIGALARLTNRVVDVESVHATRIDQLAEEYVQDISYVDWLREELEAADLGVELADVTRKVLEKAAAKSEVRNAQFATQLKERMESTGSLGNAFWVHEMTERVLAPLAARHKVLLIVLDGMSWFVFRSIFQDKRLEDWQTWVPSKGDKPLSMFATVPSVTAFSRTSLLTGRLQIGNQAKEKKEFGKQPRLIKAIGNSKKVALFHKAELNADGRGQVGHEVNKAIMDAKHQVVGVVINAVDDQLGGASQLSMNWTLDSVAPLRSLLDLAEESKRTVIITSDHGHIWESGSTRDIGATAARYRSPGALSDGELNFSGPMISESGEGKNLVVAWSEKVRYTGDKRGYHGGAAMQEVVTPCIVLTQADDTLESHYFSRLRNRLPSWWEFGQTETVIRIGDTSSGDDLPLLNITPKPSGPVWIEALMESTPLATQEKRVVQPPTSDVIRSVLATLHANHGKAHIDSIAEALSYTPQRAKRSIIATQAMLNLDGFQILMYNRTENMIQLDLQLLAKQFGIEI